MKFNLKFLGFNKGSTSIPKALQKTVDAIPASNIEVRVMADQIIQDIPGVTITVKDCSSFKILRANEEASRVLGFPEARLLSKTIHELIRDEASAQLIEAADRETVRLGSHHMESWIVTNDGAKRRFRTNRFVFNDKYSSRKYLVTMGQDITEQYTMSMKAEDLDRTTQALLTRLPFPIVWLDRKQIIKGNNLAFNKLTHSDLPVNHGLLDVFPFVVSEKIRAVCKLAETLNQIVSQQVTIWNSSGTVTKEFIINASPMHDVYSQVTGTVVAMYDITDIVESTRVTREVSRAFDMCADSVMLINRANEVTYCNAEFSKQYGYSSKEIVGHTTALLKSGKHEDEFYQNLWSTVTSGSTWQGSMIDKAKDGTLVTAPTTIVPITNGGRIPVSYLVIKYKGIQNEKTASNTDQHYTDDLVRGMATA